MRLALRLLLAGLAAVALGVLLRACNRGERPVAIHEVRVVDESHLEITLAGCYEHVRTDVDQERDQVEVRAYGSDPVNGDCGNYEIVSLTEPLGDRVVVDGATGRTLELAPADG